MSKESRIELANLLQIEYKQASAEEKTCILNKFVGLTNHNRKYAIRLLNGIEPIARKPRQRKRRYDQDVVELLIVVWKAANRIASKRLVPSIPKLVAKLEKHGHISVSEQTKERLYKISPTTVDRLLSDEKKKYGRSKSTTRPGRLLKSQIPVRPHDAWEDGLEPGYLEADLVAHCGQTVAGKYNNTLTATDIASGWTELVGLKSKDHTLRGLLEATARFPFPVKGLDTDNGTEFINFPTYTWCRAENVKFTRGRESKKNDQAHVEEKNGSIVRRVVGYDRYEGTRSCALLNELYASVRLYFNYFQPCMKLVSKERIGGKVRKKYDRAQTPHERLLKSAVSPEIKQVIDDEYELLDPQALLERIEVLQGRLWATAIAMPGESSINALAQILSDAPDDLEKTLTLVREHSNDLRKRLKLAVSSIEKKSARDTPQAKIIKRILDAAPGTVFRGEDFYDIAQPRSTRTILVRLNNQDFLVRIKRGRYQLK